MIMITKPNFGDSRYYKMSFQEKSLNYEWDLLLYEQAVNSQKASEEFAKKNKNLEDIKR